MKSSTRKPAKSSGQTSRIPQRFFCDFLVANARLIAAAPDLLAACSAALDYLGRIEEQSEGCELRDTLRAAIARAEAKP